MRSACPQFTSLPPISRKNPNNQGGLDPLEIGIHAFERVSIAKGGRGNKGGLSEYAKLLGKDQSHLSKYRDAGEVAKNIGIDAYVFLGRANHLAAIHKLNRECWQPKREIVAQSLVENPRSRIGSTRGNWGE